jgi:hypothetical protein
MEKETVSQSDKEKFLATSALFLKEFEASFVDYFVCLCSSYDKAIYKRRVKKDSFEHLSGTFQM